MDGEKKITLGNGMEIIMRPDPMFGMWKLYLAAGQLPQALTGRYMSAGDASRAVEDWYGKVGVTKMTDPTQARRYTKKVNEVRVEMGLEEK